MRVHHLNCATLCPPGAALFRLLELPEQLVCHCLLVETKQGLVLVDTGLGLGDVAEPLRLGRSFLMASRPRLDPLETAVRQVEACGFAKEDVRDIVLTHLDLDHAGGIADFPAAKVHVLAAEYGAAMRPRTFAERKRYKSTQWAHQPDWMVHAPLSGENWFGFDAVRALPGAEEELLLVPLFGHTRGHCAVAVRTPKTWLLHCGDAYFFGGEVAPEFRSPPVFELLARLNETDRIMRLRNRQRLRELSLAHALEVSLFCSHDPAEYHAHVARF